ncbi:exonuclease [Propionibacterium phage PHL301M00]|uniref:Exonuclease n=1 Tax=Propionibacterium phage PHL301M00 TaxID=1500831 RepID=A0A0E3DPB9_9CAUD|nr:exonuclease [Propionibacterium phage PHL301M00]AII30112.1 exonuclease [Propionibacterium phage PHL301M00]
MPLAQYPKTINHPGHISYSSLSQWAECGEKWRLSHGYKAAQHTWYATIAGSAIHHITEQHDLHLHNPTEYPEIPDNLLSFKNVFDTQVALAQSEGIQIKPSGRACKNMRETGGPNKKDYDWWMMYGPIFTDRWKQWRTNHPQYHVAVIDGQPGIEYPVETTLDDGTKIVGYIDRVFTDTDTGETFILDLKTGRLPADNMQLHTYRYMLNQHDINVTKGMFWTPASSRNNSQSPIEGTATELYDLDNNTYRHVSSMYSQAMKGISEGIFVPHVTPMCKGCPVRDACWAVDGKDAYRYPIETIIEPPTQTDEEHQ